MYRTIKDVIEDFPNPFGVLANGSPCGPRNTSCRYAMGNLNGGAHDPATAVRKYRELTVQVDRLLRDGWTFNASYSWTKLYGNWDLDHVVTNNLQFFASSALHDGDGIFIDDPLRYGRLRGDHPHLLKLFASREIWRELSVGGYLRAQSGSAYQAVRDDSQGFDLRHLEPAGSRRTETWTNVDLLMQYGLSLGGSRRVVLGGVIANVFDEQAVLFVDQRTHVGTFEQPTHRAEPRRFVATARLDF
jgi:outer membrane receptor protein involved in Fe transport